MKALDAFIKMFVAPKSSVKIKIYINFNFNTPFWNSWGRKGSDATKMGNKPSMFPVGQYTFKINTTGTRNMSTDVVLVSSLLTLNRYLHPELILSGHWRRI